METPNTPKSQKHFSFKKFLTTLTLASTLAVWASSCQENDDNIAEPENIESNENFSDIYEVCDLLRNNEEIRNYFGSYDSDFYLEHLEDALQIFWNKTAIGDAIARIFNDPRIHRSVNDARVEDPDTRPEAVIHLWELLLGLSQKYPSDQYLIG